MVECQLPKLDVAGSTPVSRSIFSYIYKNSSPCAFVLNGINGVSTSINSLLGNGLCR